MGKLIVSIIDWKFIVAFLIVGILVIINLLATNNLAGTFKSKEHRNKIQLLNINGGLIAIVLLLLRIVELVKFINNVI